MPVAGPGRGHRANRSRNLHGESRFHPIRAVESRLLLLGAGEVVDRRRAAAGREQGPATSKRLSWSFSYRSSAVDRRSSAEVAGTLGADGVSVNQDGVNSEEVPQPDARPPTKAAATRARRPRREGLTHGPVAAPRDSTPRRTRHRRH